MLIARSGRVQRESVLSQPLEGFGLPAGRTNPSLQRIPRTTKIDVFIPSGLCRRSPTAQLPGWKLGCGQLG